MKKFTLLAAVLGLAFSANAAELYGFKAAGYDDVLHQVTGRIGLGANDLDVGVGLDFNSANSGDAQFTFSASGFYLIKLHEFGVIDNYLALGGVLSKDAAGDFGVTAFGGLQPEITLLDRLILSTRFGANVAVSPDFRFYTAGQGISIVGGLNFKVLF